MPRTEPHDLTEVARLDLLEGAGAIAAFMYGDPGKRRTVYHAAARAGLPVFRIGGVICARKATLVRWIADQESRVAETHAPLGTDDAADTNHTDEE